jgi:hypothetical protein
MEPLIPPFWFLDREQNPIFLCTATVLVAAYIDQRADDKQTEALGAIFTGVAGGPMAALAPLIGKNLGVKKV